MHAFADVEASLPEIVWCSETSDAIPVISITSAGGTTVCRTKLASVGLMVASKDALEFKDTAYEVCACTDVYVGCCWNLEGDLWSVNMTEF